MTTDILLSKVYNNTKRQNTMRQRIRLTEGDLHRIVRQCVNEALNELDARTYASYAQKRQAQGQTDKARQGRQAAVNAWNRDYSQDNERMDDLGRVKRNYWYNKTPQSRSNDYDVHRTTYVPSIDKTDHSLACDNGLNFRTTDIWRTNGYDGTNLKGAEVARQMAQGNGKYVKGQGWQ